MMFSTLLCVAVHVFQIHSSRILSIMPLPFHSHQAAFQPLWRELALRGHEITVITTNPQKNASLTNLKEIDVSFTYDLQKNKYADLTVEYNTNDVDISRKIMETYVETLDAQLSSTQVQELIHNKSIQFDLLMAEVQMPGMLSFAWRFQCPLIGLLSYDCSIDYHAALGNPIHPVLNPLLTLDTEDVEDLSFTERLGSLILSILYKYGTPNIFFPMMHDTAKQYFGNDLVPLQEIQNNISMLFIGTHPIFNQLRPLNLNTIPVGGMMHLKEPKLLPYDLKQFLDGADNGAILFSMGTEMKNHILTAEFRKIIIDALARLPYKVLVKMDGELEGVSQNIMRKEWVPQQDVLRHPNLKLFITHGGLYSLKEAVYSNVPVIGIPFMLEQSKNIDRVVKNGYGIKVDRKKLSGEILLSAIDEVMNNPRYRQRVEELGEIFRDEEIPSLQRAVYWTEYVIRHKGAKHLRNPAYGMPAWKYYMFDLFGFVALVAFLIIFASYRLVKFVYRTILKLSRTCKTFKDKVN